VKTVPLYGAKARGRVALVDDQDYELVMAYRWNVIEPTRQGRTYGPYAQASEFRPDGRKDRHKSVFMHKLITGWPLTDHADGDGLNNQRYNLRAATGRQNNGNRRKLRAKSSRFKGVSWFTDPRTATAGWWRAYITIDGHMRSLGYHASEQEAARAYNRAARETFGEFANFNEVTPQFLRPPAADAATSATTHFTTSEHLREDKPT